MPQSAYLEVISKPHRPRCVFIDLEERSCDLVSYLISHYSLRTRYFCNPTAVKYNVTCSDRGCCFLDASMRFLANDVRQSLLKRQSWAPSTICRSDMLAFNSVSKKQDYYLGSITQLWRQFYRGNSSFAGWDLVRIALMFTTRLLVIVISKSHDQFWTRNLYSAISPTIRIDL
jgi:hypothetical protein